MKKRARGRPAQRAVTDTVLLDAALRAFAEYGYEGASVREIARLLKVSHNLIPQRFGSKERLWYTAIDHGFGRLAGDLKREGESLGSDELQVLRGLIRSFIEINALHPSLLQIINQEASQPGARLDYLFDTYIKPVRDFGEAWLLRLTEEGRIKPTSATLLYFFMTHGAGGLFALPALTTRLNRVDRTSTQASIHDQAESIVDMLFNGILPR